MGLGLGGTDAPQVRSRKSMSNERTFSATKDETFFHQKLGERKYLSTLIFVTTNDIVFYGNIYINIIELF